MEATVLYGARDVRFEDRPEPTIIEPTDAVIACRSRVSAGRTSGHIAAFNRSPHRRRWAMSTAGS